MTHDRALRGGRAARLVLGALALLLIACALRALIGFDAGPLGPLLEKWGYNVVLVGSSLACLARAALVRSERLAWLILGLGALSWALGNVYYTAVLWDLEEIPVPSPSDALWIPFYPAAYVAVVLLMRKRISTFHATLWIDGLIAALAVGAVSAAVVFQSVSATTGGPAAEVATNLSYPLADLLLCGMVIGGVALTGWKPGRTWGALAISFLVFAVGDSIYLFGNAAGTWEPGTVMEASWPAARMLLGWAAWLAPMPVRPRPLEGARVLIVPLSFALVSLWLLVIHAFGNLNVLAIVLAALSMLAVMARFAVTFFANLALLNDTRHEALTDALTGLGNRRRLVRDLEAALAADERRWVLALYDLNGFKAYNDIFGHPAGDGLLARLGERLAGAVGAEHAYRMGGDEFCVLCPQEEGIDPVGAGRLALSERGEGFVIEAAHGSVLLPAEAHEAAEALGRADRRMYADKAGGRRSTEEQSRDVLLRALEAHHPDLGEHGTDVGQLAEAVASRLGLHGQSLSIVRQAADLHDIGKVAIPGSILDKPGRLDADEWAFIERHTVVGERILSAAPALASVAGVVRSSHERYDGTGYPDRLAGEAIPIGARIVAVCDAFAAMTSERPYQPKVSTADALAELRRCAGSQFDPNVVHAFVAVAQPGRAASEDTRPRHGAMSGAPRTTTAV